MRKVGHSESESRSSELSRVGDWWKQLEPDATTRWFELDPTPVFVLGSDLSVLAANLTASRLLNAGAAASVRARRLVFSHVEAQECFADALEKITSGAASQAVIVVLCDDGRWRRLEIFRAAESSIGAAYVTVRGDPARLADIGPLLDAFMLSGAEGKVLQALVQGLTPKRVAARLHVSPNTVRAHLRNLYMKMRVRGLNELMRETTRLTV